MHDRSPDCQRVSGAWMQGRPKNWIRIFFFENEMRKMLFHLSDSVTCEGSPTFGKCDTPTNELLLAIPNFNVNPLILESSSRNCRLELRYF